MNVRFFALSLILGTVLLPIAVNAQGMGGGGMGRGENARGIINLNTSNTSLDGGLFSDLFQSGYVEYDGEYDCVVISVPVEDGVDQSRLVFFAPFGPNTNCPGTGKNLRQLAVAWPSGRGPFNLNGVDGAEAVERIDSRLGCDEVFPKDSPLGEDPPGETTTSCSLEVREYDEFDEFERTWILEWPAVTVRHHELDRRQIEDSGEAKIFQLVPSAMGMGRKDKVLQDEFVLPLDLEINRVRE